uniref:inactive protein RESTRICTED TEV MOVEMENT 2-like n=1 Tax=Erigeron canadensis TaxID=72917 RepID=UPI001CB8C05A|nr:inactive protein RESTRICTED TEV MOVEMENT 2-like [Erigeron canadensis]
MAMRGRGGRGNPSRPPRLITGRVYEQFKPMSEWRQEDDYDTLLVYLPGFIKEYIRVTTEDMNIVRVRGERLVTENKWSRFQEDYKVPENCEMRDIRARFDGGILTITMPRKMINVPPAAAPTTATTTPVPPKTDEQPFRKTRQEEALPKPKEEPIKEKKPVDNKPQSSTPLEDNSNSPPQLIMPTFHPDNKPTKLAPISTPRMNPLEDTLSPQQMPTSSFAPSKQEPLKTTTYPKAKAADEKFTFGLLPTASTTVPKKDKHNVVEKPNVSEKAHLDAGKRLEDEEMKSNFVKGSSGQANDGRGGFQGDKMEERNSKDVVARRSRTMNEDRKLLVNVGVGVLVIVALGIHVSYTIGLIGKGK